LQNEANRGEEGVGEGWLLDFVVGGDGGGITGWAGLVGSGLVEGLEFWPGVLDYVADGGVEDGGPEFF
jgi:hypothetical protein